MELLVLAFIAWLAWKFLFKNEAENGPEQRKQRAKTQAEIDNERWLEKRREDEVRRPERRQNVLIALRANQLSQKQLANILEASSHFGFSAEERNEIQAYLQPSRPIVPRQRETCRVCGHEALPGEDFCYFHHAK